MNQKNNEDGFIFSEAISLQKFAIATQINEIDIIKWFFLKGILVTINTALEEAQCKELCINFNIPFFVNKKINLENDSFKKDILLSKEDKLIDATPVIVIAGHVNHGKTTLLDKIRSSNITQKEYANITQHIGAYQILHNDSYITFLDTPGHEAFVNMRRMGGRVADILVLVISAVDGIQQQTLEIIEHINTNNLKVIVFINKIDKGDSLLPIIKKDLMKNNIVLEEFGGETLLILGSASNNKGVSELLDAILLLSSLDQKKTTLDGQVIGVIIESKVQKGMGNTATVLTYRGVLNVSDFIVMPSSIGKIKTMQDENSISLKFVIPFKPVTLSGFKDLPHVGDKFISFKNENLAKEKFEKIKIQKEEKLFLLNDSKQNEKILNLIIKTDTKGTSQAILNLLKKMSLNIHLCDVGNLNESDITLAKLTNSKLINFNQKVSPTIENLAKENKIILKSYKSVYELDSDIEDWNNKNIVAETVEKTLGTAEVVKTWFHSKIGTIAGSIVKKGKINIKNKVKVIRDKKVLITTTIKSFKTEAFEIKDAKENQECGIVLANYNEIQVGDFIEAFIMIEENNGQ